MRRPWFRILAALLLVLVLQPAALDAQPAPVEEFRPMTAEELAAEQEQIPAAGLVFAAYGIVWLTFAFYLLTLWRRVAKVESELKTVASKLEHPAR